MRIYPSFTDCFCALVEQVYLRPQFEPAPRGMKIKELIGVAFSISNPLDRLPYVLDRKFSVTYFAAETLFYLLGEKSVDWISNYASFWNDLSDDGTTVNSAYGARLFKRDPSVADGQIVQWDYAKNELRSDPDSRRAVMHLRTPCDSIKERANKDVPCTLTIQFLLREQKLHAIVNMRSSDLIWGLCYDVPFFTLLQELMALELGVDVGTYTHVSGSLHIYERHFEMCKRILSSSSRVGGPAMPKLKRMPDTKILGEFERRIRSSSSTDLDWIESDIRMLAVDIDSFEQDLLLLLIAQRRKQLCENDRCKRTIASCSFAGFGFFDR